LSRFFLVELDGKEEEDATFFRKLNSEDKTRVRKRNWLIKKRNERLNIAAAMLLSLLLKLLFFHLS